MFHTVYWSNANIDSHHKINFFRKLNPSIMYITFMFQLCNMIVYPEFVL